MRKFVFSIISLVNMILAGIAFGLGSNTAMYISKAEENPSGNFYQLVFPGSPGKLIAERVSPANIICFVLLVLASVLAVLALIPSKERKVVNVLGGGSFIAAGVLTLWVPTNYMLTTTAPGKLHFFSSGSLIAMAVLLIVAGALALLGAIIEFIPKKEK